MEKTNWKDIALRDCDSDFMDYDEFVKALQQYRKTGAIDGCFFEQGWGSHEDPEDASTWGPKSAGDIDWEGFPEM